MGARFPSRLNFLDVRDNLTPSMIAAEVEEVRNDPASSFSRWLFPALIISILLHLLFWFWARTYSFAASGREVYDRIVPRTFHLERVEIDAKLLAHDPATDRQNSLAPESVDLPDEQASFEKLMADNKGEPAAPKIDQAVLSEKPTAAATTLEETMQMAKRSGAQSILEDTRSLQTALLSEKPGANGQPAGKILDPQALTGRADAKTGPLRGMDTPGFSNLDDLLARTGPLTPETAPILMPTDLLFDYDQISLRPEALASLEKLGTLIRRNPQATFLIEGHSDSFGSDDYNLDLSERRAETVKAWLVTVMKISPERIAARGFGESRLIAPGSGTIEEQQINRRVEIVIRAK
jgi:outer membrane protein OmpA-like peptidoglycan-associated protein